MLWFSVLIIVILAHSSEALHNGSAENGLVHEVKSTVTTMETRTWFLKKDVNLYIFFVISLFKMLIEECVVAWIPKFWSMVVRVRVRAHMFN